MSPDEHRPTLLVPDAPAELGLPPVESIDPAEPALPAAVPGAPDEVPFGSPLLFALHAATSSQAALPKMDSPTLDLRRRTGAHGGANSFSNNFIAVSEWRIRQKTDEPEPPELFSTRP